MELYLNIDLFKRSMLLLSEELDPTISDLKILDYIRMLLYGSKWKLYIGFRVSEVIQHGRTVRMSKLKSLY